MSRHGIPSEAEQVSQVGLPTPPAGRLTRAIGLRPMPLRAMSAPPRGLLPLVPALLSLLSLLPLPAFAASDEAGTSTAQFLKNYLWVKELPADA